MSTQRIIGDFDLNLTQIIIKDSSILNQMRRVLRLVRGDRIILSDGKGREADCEIIRIGSSWIEVAIIRKYDNNNELKKCVTLYCAILKKENFELVVQKATEIGIRKIVPLISNRTVKREIKMDRMNKIIKEAVEQSGRGRIPLLQDPIVFKDAVKTARVTNNMNLLFHAPQINSKSQIKISDRIGIFIGPEGGWTNSELDLASSNKFIIKSLGPLILRAETAAIVSSYIISHDVDNLI